MVEAGGVHDLARLERLLTGRAGDSISHIEHEKFSACRRLMANTGISTTAASPWTGSSMASVSLASNVVVDRTAAAAVQREPRTKSHSHEESEDRFTECQYSMAGEEDDRDHHGDGHTAAG